MRVITADGKKVQDVQGYVETDVTLGEHKLKGVRILVFKRATNPCHIGRDVLEVHPSTTIGSLSSNDGRNKTKQAAASSKTATIKAMRKRKAQASSATITIITDYHIKRKLKTR